MRAIPFTKVTLGSGFVRSKKELNERVTLNAVYDRFDESGRFRAFDFTWKEGDPEMPHFFWDSDVAKWMEGAAYALADHPDEALKSRVDTLIDKIIAHQCEDGYFNIHFTVVEPEKRFTNRDWHELYCAGHLMEAAVAYAEATGDERFLKAMENYALLIKKVFIDEKSAPFHTPGHEEIELALFRLYRYTGDKTYLDMGMYFLNARGTYDDERIDYNQSHKPVREQREAVGHAVRAMYLYAAMADGAKETGDEALKAACKALFDDVTKRKMYVTGGIGSCAYGEAFSKPFDLPNAEAYTETCAGIGLIFFAERMLALENNAAYADAIERVFYNGVLSGLSADGRAFFYENPLEITMQDHFATMYGAKRYPITQRVAVFFCSCCPPNLNRLLPTLTGYVFGVENDTLFVNQYTACTLHDGDLSAEMSTAYPNDGRITVTAKGAKTLALRIPAWCAAFTLDKPYTLRDGYAYVENDGSPVTLTLDITPQAIRANVAVSRDAGRICVMAGPIVYCAESVDNGENLHAISVSPDFTWKTHYAESLGLNTLQISAFRTSSDDSLYARVKGQDETTQPITLKLLPYCYFANRGESDMLVWFRRH